MKQKAHEKNENNKKNEKNEKNEKKKTYVQTNDGRHKTNEIINVENEVFNVDEQLDTAQHNTEVGINTKAIVAGSDFHEQVPQLSPHEGRIAADGSSSIPQLSPHEGRIAADGSSSSAQEQQHNSFHVLSPVSPKQMLHGQDKQLEQELNEGTDDAWSTDSQGSFVDTTQFGVESLAATQTNAIVQVSMGNSSPRQAATNQASVPVVGDTNMLPEAVPIPDKVARDMAFLKESWANMTEADEAFQNFEPTNHEVDITNQGFQIHMSKQQKKTLKKLKQSSRDSYATRSKVPSKPFR
jgi:hypothetical protein